MLIIYDKTSEQIVSEQINLDNVIYFAYVRYVMITINQSFFQLLNLSTLLDNTNLDQPITK